MDALRVQRLKELTQRAARLRAEAAAAAAGLAAAAGANAAGALNTSSMAAASGVRPEPLAA